MDINWGGKIKYTEEWEMTLTELMERIYHPAAWHGVSGIQRQLSGLA